MHNIHPLFPLPLASSLVPYMSQSSLMLYYHSTEDKMVNFARSIVQRGHGNKNSPQSYSRQLLHNRAWTAPYKYCSAIILSSRDGLGRKENHPPQIQFPIFLPHPVFFVKMKPAVE
ncbi:hypothetical protein ABKN59_009344 [Abortiporus biennis]